MKNKQRHFFPAGLLGLALVLLGSGGCLWEKNTQWAGQNLITFYAIPPVLQLGDMQLAVRIQDRDYKIVQVPDSRLEVIGKPDGKSQGVELKPGLGKDLRGWVRFSQPGKYEALFSFVDASGQTQSARFGMYVPGEKGK